MADTTIMKKSSKDKICFTHEVYKRFVKLRHQYKTRHLIFSVPKEIQNSIKGIKGMQSRYNKGDFRHTDSEVAMELSIARWLVDSAASLNGTTPRQTTWSNISLFEKK